MKRTIVLFLLAILTFNAWANDYEKYYAQLPTKVAKVIPFSVPNNEVRLTDFGGVGDGVTLNTDAFTKAISHLSKLGGGRLVVPDGVWLTGPIALKDNIELNVQKNAIIYFSPDKSLSER